MRSWQVLTLSLLAAAGCGSGTESSERPEKPARPAQLEIVAGDFSFDLEPVIVATGDVETTLINKGEQIHQAAFYRLNDGVEYDEFERSILEDDSLIPQLAEGGRAGVVRVVSPGDTYVRPSDELPAGSYSVICFIKDPETGKNHFELGMIARFEVR